MDMSDLSSVPIVVSDDPALVCGSADGWRDVVSKVGQEVAQPLTTALDRVTLLAETGRIDRQSLRALRMEIERARHAAMVGQQLARLSTGDLRHAAEHLPLPAMLKDLLASRQADLQDHGLVVRPLMSPSHVHADPALVFALLNACLDWAIPHAHEAIDARLEVGGERPGSADHAHACLTLQFQHRQALPLGTNADALALGGSLSVQNDHGGDGLATLPDVLVDLNWVLLTQTAQASGVQLRCLESAGRIVLVLDFPALVGTGKDVLVE